MVEGVGFEPTERLTTLGSFQDCCNNPSLPTFRIILFYLKTAIFQEFSNLKLVSVVGFEPTTYCSQSSRSPKLNYTLNYIIYFFVFYTNKKLEVFFIHFKFSYFKL